MNVNCGGCGGVLLGSTCWDCHVTSSWYRYGGNIVHSHIMAAQRPSHGYTLNGISSPVLYKLIHYFMENPIHGSTVLQFPVEDRDVSALAFHNRHCIVVVCMQEWKLSPRLNTYKFVTFSQQHVTSNCAVALQDFTGDITKNELTFTTGSLITNISRKSIDW